MDDVIHSWMAWVSSSLHWQLRPWVPRRSTSNPQWLHSCGLQRGVQSPTATRTVSLSIRKTRLDTGRACSQAPDSFLLVARSFAWDLASGALLVRVRGGESRNVAIDFCPAH